MHQPCSITSIPTHPVDRDAIRRIARVNKEGNAIPTVHAGEGGIAFDLMIQRWSGQTPIPHAGTRIFTLDGIWIGPGLRMHARNCRDHDQQKAKKPYRTCSSFSEFIL
jgi:hypothetical protein